MSAGVPTVYVFRYRKSKCSLSAIGKFTIGIYYILKRTVFGYKETTLNLGYVYVVLYQSTTIVSATLYIPY